MEEKENAPRAEKETLSEEKKDDINLLGKPSKIENFADPAKTMFLLGGLRKIERKISLLFLF